MNNQMFSEYFYEIILISYRYFRLSIFPILFVIAIYYLVSKSNNKLFRSVSAYPAVAIVLSINPLTYYFLLKFVDFESYYRVYWISFIPFLISLFLIELLNKPSIMKRIIVLISLISIFISGKFSYLSNDFDISDNPYKLNDSIIETSDFLVSYNSGNEIIVLCSNIFGLQVRQYEPRIKLISAQYQVNQKSSEISQLTEMINQEMVDLYPNNSLIQSLQIDYIVLNTNQKMIIYPDSNEYEFLTAVTGFQIYKVINK